MEAISLIEKEVESYISGTVQISEGYNFSQYALVKRISLFANQIIPSGKTDSQGNYKYYFDIIGPRIDSEIKNIDFDTKDIQLYSDSPKDFLAIFLANAALKEWMRHNGQADELNEAIEESAGWGNVVWKKVKGSYERMDLRNLFVINQTAKDLTKSPVIERHEMTQADLREKAGVWKNVDDVIRNCANKHFTATERSAEIPQEVPSYEIYERNGEVSERALFEAQGKNGGDEDKYVLAKVVVAGIDKNSKEGKYVLFADTITKMPYKEHHRGRYTGRWFRKGLYETLFDIQVRGNEIGNQIARGLEWSSKTIFRSSDQLVAQNMMTDLLSGDVLRSTDLQQVEVRMEGFDQLVADWNRLMELADRLANSFEVISGEGLPSGTPFRLGALLNQNANKLFEYLREKLGLSIQSIFQDWILPDLMSSLKTQDILRLTGDSDYLKRFQQMVVDAWYLENLPILPPHDKAIAETLKAEKLQEIQQKPELMVSLEKGLFDNVKPRVQVIITGEQMNLPAELETLANFIQLEMDPVRRQALIERAMALKGFDVGALPKSDPAMLAGAQPQQERPSEADKTQSPKQPLAA